MGKRLSCFVILLFALDLASGVVAAEKEVGRDTKSASELKSVENNRKPKAKNAAKSQKPLRMTGEITAMDAKTGTVAVKGPSAEITFVTQDAAKDALEVVKVGDRVRMTYSEKDGKAVATSLRRMKAKTASSGGKKKKAAKESSAQTQREKNSKKPE